MRRFTDCCGISRNVLLFGAGMAAGALFPIAPLACNSLPLAAVLVSVMRRR